MSEVCVKLSASQCVWGVNIVGHVYQAIAKFSYVFTWLNDFYFNAHQVVCC